MGFNKRKKRRRRRGFLKAVRRRLQDQQLIRGPMRHKPTHKIDMIGVTIKKKRRGNPP